MPDRQYRTLSKRIVDRLAVDGKDAAGIIARIKAVCGRPSCASD